MRMSGVRTATWALLAVLGTATVASAAPLTVATDSSWLTTNSAPAAGWNTSTGFNTSTWSNAVEFNTAACVASTGAGCIWYDGQFTNTQTTWFRKTFTVSGPVTSGFLQGGVDDDASIWVNGTLVYQDVNGFAQNFGPIDISAYLQPGLNLIAATGWDNFPVYGINHAFAALLTVQTATVPEPSTALLLGAGLAVMALARRRVADRRP